MIKQIEQIQIQIQELEEVISTKEQEFEQQIKSEKELLKEMKLKQEQLKESLIEQMENEGIGNKKGDLYTFSLCKRQGLKITDEKVFSDYLVKESAKLKNYLKDEIKTKDELIDFILPRKIDLTNAKTLAKRAKDIDELTLPGTEESITKFITMKKYE